jgi:DNA-binding NtrC family response regulator
MAENGTVLVVDDERIAARNLEHLMKKEGYDVRSAQSGAAAFALLEQQPFDVVLTDLRMEKIDGMQVLARCKALHPDAEVVLVTGYATTESAVQAMKDGAFYYIAKPFRLDEVRKVVAEAMAKIRLKRENRELRDQLEQFRGKVKIVTQDAGMQRLLALARQIAPTDCNVIVTGESGTGKELLARYVHLHSRRADGPFVGVNCGALNEELLANELFGHDKGAFTGAHADKAGLIETARGGTLFLDEVTEMSPAMQVKLLRVIQEREVMRVGGTRAMPVDVRFVAATNRDLQAAMKEGAFRQDLYFRLNVVNLHLPPLAARRGDVPLLAYYFLKKHAALMGRESAEISADALALLEAYSFPGNVRELENLIERAVAIGAGPVVRDADLPDDLRNLTIRVFRRRDGRIPTLDEQERDYIRWVLAETNGNQTAAAQALGIDRVSLWRKLKRFESDA